MPEIIVTEDGQYWEAFLNRDKAFDGRFFVGVKSTGIYCKPSCPAKKPGFLSCKFFETKNDAVMAGFRPCKRCRPEVEHEKIMSFSSNVPQTPGSACGYYQFCSGWAEKAEVPLPRLRNAVKEVTGLSPREFLVNRKVEAFRRSIQSGENVTSALYSAGFGSSSRLYERACRKLGMTPGRYKNGGNGERILFTILNTPYGESVGGCDKNWCLLNKIWKLRNRVYLNCYASEFPQAEISADTGELLPWINVISTIF